MRVVATDPGHQAVTQHRYGRGWRRRRGGTGDGAGCCGVAVQRAPWVWLRYGHYVGQAAGR